MLPTKKTQFPKYHVISIKSITENQQKNRNPFNKSLNIQKSQLI